MDTDKENPAESISLLRAEAMFKELFSNSSVRLTNPTLIYDELSNLKDLSSKLKFQYLEQETRDKFLRHILLDHEQEVSQSDVDALAEQNVRAKGDLKAIKEDLQQLLQESESVSDDIITLNKECENKLRLIDEAVREVALLLEKLDALMNDPSDDSCATLFNMHKLVGTEDLDLDEAISIANNAVLLEQLAVDEARARVASAGEIVTDNIELVIKLETEFRSLQDQIASSEILQEGFEKDPHQVYAQTLLEVDSALRRFIGPEISLNAEDGVFKLRFKDVAIDLDALLSIIEALGSVNQKAVELINCAGEDKFWRLLRLLSELVCGI